MKKRILLVVDNEEWALGNIAYKLKENLKEFYDINVVTLEMFKDNIVKIMILSKKYDLIHFLWRGHIYWLYSDFAKDYIKNLGYEFKEFSNEFVSNNIITTTICDHLFLTEDEEKTTELILSNVKNYIVTSQKLKEIYNNIPNVKSPKCVIHDGVDLNMFYKKKEGRKDNNIRIGWAENSKFTDSENDADLKGLNKIIKPAIKELKEEGYNIEEKFADRNEGMIPHEKMPEYYNSIDVYICASKTEGTPAPVLEAMACGIPIISTDVGIVPEAFGEKQKEFIMEERTKECLKSKLKKLIENKEYFEELSKENLEQIKKWDWKTISLQYKEFFDENLKDGEIKNA